MDPPTGLVESNIGVEVEKVKEVLRQAKQTIGDRRIHSPEEEGRNQLDGVEASATPTSSPKEVRKTAKLSPRLEPVASSAPRPNGVEVSPIPPPNTDDEPLDGATDPTADQSNVQVSYQDSVHANPLGMTGEEDKDVVFKMRAKLFNYDAVSREWKRRGLGYVRLVSHPETKRIRLVMRRDKTLSVCANFFVSADMKLQPTIGSDRSWAWKVAADFSESDPTSEVFGMRFKNHNNAELFKAAFEDAQNTNITLSRGL